MKCVMIVLLGLGSLLPVVCAKNKQKASIIKKPQQYEALFGPSLKLKTIKPKLA